MAATTQVISFHDTGGSQQTDVKGEEIRFKRADNDTVDLDNPVMIPGDTDPAGTTHYSQRKHTKINFTSTPTGSISNLVWFLDDFPTDELPAKNWDGLSLYVGTSSSYTLATSGDESAQIGGLVDADVTGYDAVTPLVLTAGTVLSNPSTGFGTQPYVILQMSVNKLALPGEKAARQGYYRWDEI